LPSLPKLAGRNDRQVSRIVSSKHQRRLRLACARSSVKLEGVRLRRIGLKAPDTAGKKQVFTIAPSGIMPYFFGMTDAIEKALFPAP
jgi:hypothetical protein